MESHTNPCESLPIPCSDERYGKGSTGDFPGIKIPYCDKIPQLTLHIPEDPLRDFKVFSLMDFLLGMRAQEG